jgi:ribonuclease HI
MSQDSPVLSIIAAIEALSPGQRRRLLKRLHATGLFAEQELLSDQNKLAVATAVRRSKPAPVADESTDRRPPETTQAASKPQNTPAAMQLPLTTPSGAAATSGRVVLGAPQPAEASAPHAMQPLPGQAPEQPIQIVFDGGSRGNPGEGYGSYQARWPGTPPQVVRLRFGDRMTNNEAEYDTLIAALDATLKRLAESGADPKTARLDVRGDSMLVIKQVLGEWKCKDARMEERRNRVRALLARFGQWQMSHHLRENSVRALGH